MKLAAVFVASLFVFVGCDTAAPEPAPAPPVSTEADGLSLLVSTPEWIAGTYVDPATGVGVIFEAAREGDDLFLHLATAKGKVLVHAETTADDYVFSYMDGLATLTVSKAWVAQVKAEGEDGPAAADESAARWTGDRTVLDAMLALPEIETLPWLSRALGSAGITGNTHPASLAIHKTARQSAKALDVDVPPINGNLSRCSQPTANNCYGMCGNGCNCWSWVCGDCCYHSGCAKHDSWCRNGQWYYCYNITAVVALFGC
jgi:hypothetical protein